MTGAVLSFMRVCNLKMLIAYPLSSPFPEGLSADLDVVAIGCMQGHGELLYLATPLAVGSSNYSTWRNCGKLDKTIGMFSESTIVCSCQAHLFMSSDLKVKIPNIWLSLLSHSRYMVL